VDRHTFIEALAGGLLAALLATEAQQTRKVPQNDILHFLMGDPCVQRLSRIFRPTDCVMTNARQTMDDPCIQRFR
jgi:hypothetical protein